MSDRMALKTAIDLIHVPSQSRLLRSEPLPSDVQTLLRIAAGDDEATSAAISLTGRSRKVVQQAAMFFIEQILFAPRADSYRVLGASSQASADELRRNVALLLRWLHPDLDAGSERSIFVSRVTAAWNDLKTPERRADYDERLLANVANKSQLRKHRLRSGRHDSNTTHRSRSAGQRRRGVDAIGLLRRALSVLLQRPLVR